MRAVRDLVEYLVAVASAVVLAGLLAGQFLLQAVSYGPRSRRAMMLFALPAAAGGLAVAGVVAMRPAALRAVLGITVGLSVYLTVATSAVARWRNRKVAALVGDVAALRRAIAARQRAVDELLWRPEPEGQAAPVPPPGLADAAWPSEPECAEAIDRYVGAPGSAGRARAAQVAAWRREFGPLSPRDLQARARVLEAVAADVPEEADRMALRAKLAALALAYRGRLQGRGAPEPRADAVPAPSGSWPAAPNQARKELTRLQAELAAVLRQRTALLARRLPLD